MENKKQEPQYIPLSVIVRWKEKDKILKEK